MGESGSSDSSWKKLVIAKANDQWVSSTKTEIAETAVSKSNFSLDYEPGPCIVKTETVDDDDQHWQNSDLLVERLDQVDPLSNFDGKKRKSESSDERAARLAKMSAYAAQRIANESPEQRALRLKRMSEYAAKRLANESSGQRAKRLARMSAYAAKRLAQESPEQRKERLARMSAYAAKRHAQKKMSCSSTTKDSESVSTYDLTNY